MGAGCSSASVADRNVPRDSVVVLPSEPDPSDEETLRVEGVDFKVAENVRRHRTDEYDITESASPQLVVRRGQDFNINIHCSRPYAKKTDDLRLVFETGDKPERRKGTHVEFVLSDTDSMGNWGAKLMHHKDKSIDVKVFTPPECFVGKWALKVDVVKKKDDKVSLFRYSHEDLIFVLFNPWCKDDPVYMESHADLEEYVLNDKGKIYSGSYHRISAKPWVFGQFSGQVLDCCMYLLERSSYSERGDPISVVRKLSALVNAPDEAGVLVGNWSGDYSHGKSPLTWTGSAAILEQFYEQKSSVRYGQCWVFSGILTTVCRALGIPARSVTNFSSAHDVDASITIDKYYDIDGKPMKSKNYDSVWNFHVWNEVWLARPDLPSGYRGWQACDSTPQEMSAGVYRCGPCPVRAIKEGKVNLQYDGPFIFAEVNADIVKWVVTPDGSQKKIGVETTTVGKYISTLSLKGKREDLTDFYKHQESSESERTAVRRAQLGGSAGHEYVSEERKDVHFDLHYDADGTFVGDEFIVKLSCHNKSSHPRTVEGVVYVSTMYYTGVDAEPVTTHVFKDVQLAPRKRQDVEVKVSVDAYMGKLKDGCMLSFSTKATVKETEQIFVKTDDARLRKPHLDVKGPSTAQKGEEFEAQVSFTNPLPCKLTNCFLEVEAPGFTKAKKYSQDDVGAKETFTYSLKLKPTKKGKREIIFIFNSRELEDVNGIHDVRVAGDSTV